MGYVLSKDEVVCVINSHIRNCGLMENELEIWYNRAKEWQSDSVLYLLSYFIIQYCETQPLPIDEHLRILQRVSVLPEEIFSKVLEMDQDFIDLMMRNISNSDLLINDQVMYIQERVENHVW